MFSPDKTGYIKSEENIIEERISDMNKYENNNVWIENIDFTEGELKEKIEEIVSNPDNFLGEGGAAKVFDLGDQCIKLIKNRHNSKNADIYNLGNSPAEETRIQNLLKNLNIDGAYAPRVAAYFEGKESAAIIMERLDAVNLELVLKGREDIPGNFNKDSFLKFWKNMCVRCTN